MSPPVETTLLPVYTSRVVGAKIIGRIEGVSCTAATARRDAYLSLHRKAAEAGATAITQVRFKATALFDECGVQGGMRASAIAMVVP